MIQTKIAESTSRLSLASYNIHRCFGTDRKYYPERIAQVISSLDADVVAVQEVDMRLLVDGRPQLEYLADTLGMTAIAGPNIQDYRGVFGNAILTRLPVRNLRRIDLSVRRFEPRGAIEADVELGGGVVLRVLATHLGLNAAERRLQVRKLMHALDEGGDDSPVAVLGDFNEWKPNHGALRTINRRFGPSLAPRTFPSRFPLLPLDRIWVWPRSGLRRIAVYATPLARQASDHLPIRAEVSWDHRDLPSAWKEAVSISEG